MIEDYATVKMIGKLAIVQLYSRSWSVGHRSSQYLFEHGWGDLKGNLLTVYTTYAASEATTSVTSCWNKK